MGQPCEVTPRKGRGERGEGRGERGEGRGERGEGRGKRGEGERDRERFCVTPNYHGARILRTDQGLGRLVVVMTCTSVAR